MIKIRIGDKVILRKDIRHGRFYGDIYLSKIMYEKIKNKILKIEAISNYGTVELFYITGCWHEDMFEIYSPKLVNPNN